MRLLLLSAASLLLVASAGCSPAPAAAPAATLVPAAPTSPGAPKPAASPSASGSPAASPTIAPVAPPASAGPRTSVSVALDWVPNTNHTGIYVARQQGWYDAEGLDLTILPYAQGNSPDVQIAAGKADFGISFEEAVTLDRAANQPVVSLAAIIQKNTSAVVTLKDSGLDRPAKLEGKRYAGFGSPFEQPVLQAMINCDGGATAKFETVTANLFGVDAVQAKQADFVWIFLGWEGIAAQRQGLQLNTFSPPSYCIPNYYTPVLITSEATLKQKADVVQRFMRATARGYTYAITNPDQASDLFLKAVPSGTFPDPDLVRESARYLAPRYAEGKRRWGEQDLQVWTDYPKFMLKTGLVKNGTGAPVTGDLDYSAFFTNDFLPQ